MNDRLIDIALSLCRKNECRLIYLAKAGSHRYGTSTSLSDMDADGLFVPPKELLLLGGKINDLKYTTKEDKFKNSPDDIDLKLYSIQYFLKTLLKKCDTNALDILYSHTNEQSVLYLDDPIRKILSNKDKLIEISDIMEFSYTLFSISQSKKFGIKSSKLSLMRYICDYLKMSKFDIPLESMRLEECIHDMFLFVPKSEFMTLKTITLPNGSTEQFLLLDGKMHQLSITMDEFKNRVQTEYDKYGKRTRLAEQNEGVDWKSISHSLRGIFQMEELYHSGCITFPLKQCKILKDIKTGKYSFKEVEILISDGLDRLEGLKLEGSAFKGKRDEDFINNLILKSYK